VRETHKIAAHALPASREVREYHWEQLWDRAAQGVQVLKAGRTCHAGNAEGCRRRAGQIRVAAVERFMGTEMKLADDKVLDHMDAGTMYSKERNIVGVKWKETNRHYVACRQAEISHQFLLYTTTNTSLS
jgi:hypothetical protein